jgi:hypothetical protein
MVPAEADVHVVTNPRAPGRFVTSCRLSPENATNPACARDFVTSCMLDGDEGAGPSPSLLSLRRYPATLPHAVTQAKRVRPLGGITSRA